MCLPLSLMIRRACFALLAALTSLAISPIVVAEQIDCGNEFQGCEPVMSSCEFELQQSETANEFEDELCGWATHDSCPVPRVAMASRTSSTFQLYPDALAWPIEETEPQPSNTFEESLATAAATACASAGISVEQIIEPFAMVGPNMPHTLEQVKRFQQWWADAFEKAKAEAERAADEEEADEASEPAVEATAVEEVIDEAGVIAAVEAFPAPTVDEVLDSIAEAVGLSADKNAAEDAEAVDVVAGPIDADAEASEFAEPSVDPAWELLASEDATETSPSDLEQWGPSVVIFVETEVVEETEKADAEPSSEVPSPAVSQVGSSPIIVTLEEAYMPYDLAARDLRVWSVFPMVTDPYCSRGRSECDPIWTATEAAPAAVANESEENQPEEKVAEAPVDEADLAVVEEVDANEASVEVVAEEAAAAEVAFTLNTSPDCLLDDLIWRVDSVAIDYADWAQLTTYGDTLVRVSVRSSRVRESAVSQLASVWPLPSKIVPPVKETAGAALLARAGAVVESDVCLEPFEQPESFELGEPGDVIVNDAVQIAEAPAESTLR